MEPMEGSIAIWCHSDAMRELQYEKELFDADKYYKPRDREAEETERLRGKSTRVRAAT